MSSKRKIVLSALLMAALPGCGQPTSHVASRADGRAQEAKAMSAGQVDVRLEVTVIDGKAHATLTYTNTSTADVYLEKGNACLNGKIENDVFRLKTDEHEVEYIGRLEKRELGPNDFVKLAPQAKLTAQVTLNDAYDFLAGTHRYQGHYEALHPYPNRPGFFSLKSNEASFVLTK